MDPKRYIEDLRATDVIRKPLFKQIVKDLHLPPASMGLDVGCGIGLQTVTLAEAMGDRGQITGTDISEEFLQEAERVVDEAGLSDRISFRTGDYKKLPFHDNSFDWVWSSDCVGYAGGSTEGVFDDLIRVLKPGGQLVILAWTYQVLLAGYPLLEAKLSQTSAALAPFRAESQPEDHFLLTAARFEELGLTNPGTKTYIMDFRAPFDADTRKALHALLHMRWMGAENEVDKEDWQQLQSLIDPKCKSYLLDRNDYYGFFTYTVHRATK